MITFAALRSPASDAIPQAGLSPASQALWWAGHDHGTGHGRGGRRSGRLFDHGALRLVVLALIAERPRHGYEIIKEIEDKVAGTYSPSPGVIYPTLMMPEELGHATVAEREGKKAHAIAPGGAAYPAANRAGPDLALERMNSIRTAKQRRPGARNHPCDGEPEAGFALAPGARTNDGRSGASDRRGAGRRRRRGGAELTRDCARR